MVPLYALNISCIALIRDNEKESLVWIFHKQINLCLNIQSITMTVLALMLEFILVYIYMIEYLFLSVSWNF